MPTRASPSISATYWRPLDGHAFIPSPRYQNQLYFPSIANLPLTAQSYAETAKLAMSCITVLPIPSNINFSAQPALPGTACCNETPALCWA